MKDDKKSFTDKLRIYVDGEADTPFEYFMLMVVIINTISLGFETSPSIMQRYEAALLWIDQVCLWLFVIELIIKGMQLLIVALSNTFISLTSAISIILFFSQINFLSFFPYFWFVSG